MVRGGEGSGSVLQVCQGWDGWEGSGRAKVGSSEVVVVVSSESE